MNHSEKAVFVFNKYADLYQHKFMDVSLYADTLDYFCSHVTKQEAYILELACGPGNVTYYVLNKRPDFKLLGTDLSENMIKLAKNNNPSAEFKIMDARKLDALNQFYDGIICAFCLPYLTIEETSLLFETAYKKLNRGGLIYLSTMEDNYSNSSFKKGSTGEEIFMHYYLEGDLRELLEKNNFRVKMVQRKESILTDGSKVTDLIVIAEKTESL